MATTNSTALPARVKDETGNVYGKLTVIAFSHAENRKSYWKCLCKCGRIVIARGNELRAGLKRCCPWGCASQAQNGLSYSQEYRCWKGILARCFNPRNHAYHHYGGRGITICERWLLFSNFYADMGPRPEGMTLDRIDNDKGYSPDNCRWTTWEEQENNCSRNRFLTHDGVTLTIAQWARRLQITRGTLWHRLKAGWPIDRALTPTLRANPPPATVAKACT